MKLRCTECEKHFHLACIEGQDASLGSGLRKTHGGDPRADKMDWYCSNCIVGWRDRFIFTASSRIRQKILVGRSVLGALLPEKAVEEVVPRLLQWKHLTSGLKAFFAPLPVSILSTHPTVALEKKCFGISNSLTVGDFQNVATRCRPGRLALAGLKPDEPPSLLHLEEVYWDLLSSPFGPEVVAERAVLPHSVALTNEESKAAQVNGPVNMRHLNDLEGSALRGFGREMNTRPQTEVGMVFTTTSWTVDPHHMCLLRYLHAGTMTWYGIPSKHRSQFENLQDQTGLLHPCTVLDNNLDVSRAEQRTGEYVVTFPGVHHHGFGHVFTCLESASFAPFEWLPHAREANNRRMIASSLRPQPKLHLLPFSMDVLCVRKGLQILLERNAENSTVEQQAYHELLSSATAILPLLKTIHHDLQANLTQLLLLQPNFAPNRTESPSFLVLEQPGTSPPMGKESASNQQAVSFRPAERVAAATAGLSNKKVGGSGGSFEHLVSSMSYKMTSLRKSLAMATLTPCGYRYGAQWSDDSVTTLYTELEKQLLWEGPLCMVCSQACGLGCLVYTGDDTGDDTTADGQGPPRNTNKDNDNSNDKEPALAFTRPIFFCLSHVEEFQLHVLSRQVKSAPLKRKHNGSAPPPPTPPPLIWMDAGFFCG
jgi:hypothetical protein